MDGCHDGEEGMAGLLVEPHHCLAALHHLAPVIVLGSDDRGNVASGREEDDLGSRVLSKGFSTSCNADPILVSVGES